MRSRSPGDAVGDAVDVVLLLEPPAAEPEHDATVGDLVERRHRVREHRRVAVAGRVDERAAQHAFGRRRERGVRRDRLEAVRVAGGVGRVEVVPDRDPVEAELLDAAPQSLQLGDGRVLQTGVHSEADVHGCSSSDVGRDLGRDEPQVIEIVEVEDLQVHGLGAGVAERTDAFDDFVGESGRAALARSVVGLVPDRFGAARELGFVACRRT